MTDTAIKRERRPTSVGRRIHQARIDARMTQEQLAGACGCHRGTITNIETGWQSVSIGLLVKIAKVLNTTPDHLLQDI